MAPKPQHVGEGALSMLSQVGIGSGYNFVSEFSLDILQALGLKKDVRRMPDRE